MIVYWLAEADVNNKIPQMISAILVMTAKTPAVIRPHLFIAQHQTTCSIMNETSPGMKPKDTKERKNPRMDNAWAVMIVESLYGRHVIVLNISMLLFFLYYLCFVLLCSYFLFLFLWGRFFTGENWVFESSNAIDIFLRDQKLHKSFSWAFCSRSGLDGCRPTIAHPNTKNLHRVVLKGGRGFLFPTQHRIP